MPVILSPFPGQAAQELAGEVGTGNIQNPVQTLLSSAFQAAGDMQKFQANKQALTAGAQINQQRQMEMEAFPELTRQKLEAGAQINQQRQMEMKAFPELTRQKLEAGALTAESLKNTLKQQAFTLQQSNVERNEAAHAYAMHRLAELKNVPDSEIAKQWPEVRNELIQTGVNEKVFPEKYDSSVRKDIDRSYDILSAPDQRQFAQKLQLMMLRNQQSQINQQMKLAGDNPMEKSFGQEEGKKNSDYFDSIALNSISSQKLYNDTLQMGGTGKLASSKFGAIHGNSMALSTEGQRSLQSMSQFVLDKFETMTRIGQGTTAVLDLIKDSKAKSTISYDAFRTIVNSYRALSLRTIEKNRFADFLKNNGVVDRNRIENIWNMYEITHPIYDNNGKVNSQNIGQWENYLSTHKNLYSPIMSGAISQKTSIPPNYVFIR